MQIGYGYEENPNLPADLKEFALECAAYNNTSVYMGGMYVWIDSLKYAHVFERHLPAGRKLERVRILNENEEMGAWTGEGEDPEITIKIGKFEAVGHVYRVKVA
jgi:hypothetical protein